ncbi:DUF6048 family protein [Persicobacter psychrovividus]|uniref:Uncharacterized protein n=1 Tax=Persicobacter psychrovividus TaxID=387638 RepID=A0ABM7VB21_9BACT|nr:hypothetical protein PEPS_03990 [Persicobacter psychrovividus]
MSISEYFKISLLLVLMSMGTKAFAQEQDSVRVVDTSMYERDSVRMTPKILIDIPIVDRTDEFKTLSRKERRELERARRDSLPITVLPPISNLELMVNYSDPILGLLNNGTRLEGGGAITFFEYFVATAEFGMQDFMLDGEAYKNVTNYHTNGQYYRFGADFKIPVKEKSSIRIGGRYGMSNFSDAGTATITGDLFDDYTKQFARNNLTATWYEVNISSETNLWKGMFMGFSFRYRKMLDFDNNYDIPVRYVSGFGFANESSLAFNLFLGYRIPVLPIRYRDRHTRKIIEDF